jgi:hypothetical protein
MRLAPWNAWEEVAFMSDRWEDDSTFTVAGDGVPFDAIEEATLQYLAAHRSTTQACPLCGMRNALSITEVALGYLCEDCAGDVETDKVTRLYVRRP